MSKTILSPCWHGCCSFDQSRITREGICDQDDELADDINSVYTTDLDQVGSKRGIASDMQNSVSGLV